MKKSACLLAPVFLLLAAGSDVGSAQEPAGEPALKVLIIRGDDPAGAEGFRNLLADHGITAAVHAWKNATREQARGFDLVLVTGNGRRFRERYPILDFGRPVLGVGPYGCAYFGKFKLKNGAPYT